MSQRAFKFEVVIEVPDGSDTTLDGKPDPEITLDYIRDQFITECFDFLGDLVADVSFGEEIPYQDEQSYFPIEPEVKT